MEGFTRGRKLDKMGLHAADTAELHFENVRVPGANLLGEEGKGFYHLMTNLPSERLSIAIAAVAGARETFDETLQYVKDRKAFGQPIGSFQHNRFLHGRDGHRARDRRAVHRPVPARRRRR